MDELSGHAWCEQHFVRFIVDTVLPRIGAEVALVVGVSLSGLAVAHLALERPDLFPRIVAQSPSAWWNDEALVRRVRAEGGGAARAWFSVGSKETDTNVLHTPALHQETSQLDSVGRLAAAWGPSATSRVFEGGHEAGGWAEELGDALCWAMA